MKLQTPATKAVSLTGALHLPCEFAFVIIG
jgi:hypothetical protein